MLLYLDYMCTTIRPDGLISYGLGDWLHAGRQADDAKSPTEFVNTVLSMDICEKAAYMFGELNLEEQKQFALGIYARLRRAAREHLIDTNTMTALGRCQTSQAMAIFYSLFEPAEKPEAIRRLVELVHEQDDHMDVGIVGAQVLFHVLSEGGYGELAYEMIVRPDFPSYGQWLEGDATTLREWVWPEDRDSLNHHFRGDISHWFIRRLAGIHYNPAETGKSLTSSLTLSNSLILPAAGILRRREKFRSTGHGTRRAFCWRLRLRQDCPAESSCRRVTPLPQMGWHIVPCGAEAIRFGRCINQSC